MPRSAKKKSQTAESATTTTKRERGAALPVAGVVVAGIAGVFIRGWRPAGGQSGAEHLAELAGDGGWSQNATFAALHHVDCSIERRPNLTAAEFEAEFYAVGRPVVFRNEHANSVLLQALSQKQLRREYGGMSISAGQSAAYTRSSKVSSTMSLEGFLDAMVAVPPPDLYMFETSDFMQRCRHSHGSTPMDGYQPPSQIRQDHLTTQIVDGAARLAIGPEGTGTSFHMHGVTFAQLFFGLKRWSLYGPGASPRSGYNPDASHTDWLREVYPTLSVSERPLECVQTPGDVLFIPDGWEHATLNLGQTVAAAFEAPPTPGSAQQLFEEARDALIGGSLGKKGKRKAAKMMEKAARFNPTSAHYWNGLSNAHAELGDSKASLEAALSAVQSNPRDVQQHALLAHAYLDLGRLADALAALKTANVSSVHEESGKSLRAPLARLANEWRGTQHEGKLRRLVAEWRKVGFEAGAAL